MAEGEQMRALRKAQDADGFSLIEVLVALVVMVLVAGLVATGLITVASMNRSNRERSVAAALVEKQMDLVRLNINTASYGTTNLSPAPVLNGTTFTVTTSIEPVALGAGSGPCDGGAATGSSMTVDRVTVTATWTRMGAIKPVRADTEVAPKTPLGTTTFNIGIKVLNAKNGPDAGHTVTLTPGTHTSLTDADGCAFFTGLTSGSYTGSLNDVGWVDPSLKQTTSVVVGTTAQTAVGSVLYDQASALQLTMPGVSTLFPVPATMPVTLSATGLKTGGSAAVASCYGSQICGTFAGSSATARTVTGLYPFASGYNGWIGDCAGANLAPDNYPMTPGTTTVATAATGGAVLLNATAVGAVPSQTVTLSQATGSTGCPVAETYTVGTTTTANSNTVRVWMPYGTWKVTMTNVSTPSHVTTGTVTVNQTSTVASPATVSLAVT